MRGVWFTAAVLALAAAWLALGPTEAGPPEPGAWKEAPTPGDRQGRCWARSDADGVTVRWCDLDED